MKCAKCGSDNSKTAKFCGQCGASLMSAPPKESPLSSPAVHEPSGPFWTPDWKWHAKALTGIAVFLTALYFVLNAFLSRLPEPYRMRDIPQEMTPWLKK